MADQPNGEALIVPPVSGTNLARYGAISVGIEILSAEQAGIFLAKRRAEARLNASAIEIYRLAMISGRWSFNGAPIILSRSGVLLDGVQRLAACVAAGMSLTAAIARGVDDDVLPTIDQRRRRSFAAILAARGVPHARAQAALIDRLIRYDDGTLLATSGAAPDWDRLESALHANPGIEAAVMASQGMTTSPLPEPVRSTILYMGHRVDGPLTTRLLEALRHPERFDPTEPGVVLRAEIDRLGEDAANPANRVKLLALAVEALNALLRNERPRRIIWPSSEVFPRLAGYPGLVTAPAGPAPAKPVVAAPAPVGVSLQFETISAQDAGRYLLMGAEDATPSRKDVDAIARDIATGRWKVNAQPVCFSRSGRLLDGHHRLMAVIAANIAVPVLVVRGLAEEAERTFDYHTQRSSAARHPLSNFGDAALAAAMANLLWRREHRRAAMRAKKATPAEVQQILDRHPRLLALRGFGRRMIAYGRASVMGYAAYVVEREDPAMAGLFLRALETGANLAEGHPVLALRDQMQSLRREQATQDKQFEALMDGWRRFKAYQSGNTAPEPPAPSPKPDRVALRTAAPSGRSWQAPAGVSIPGIGKPRQVVTDPVADPDRAMRQQALLASFSRSALRSGDLATIIRDAARLAAEESGVPFSRVLQYEAETGTLLLREGAGWGAESLGQVRFHLDPRFPASQAFTTGRPSLHPAQPGARRIALPPFLLKHGVRRSLDVIIPGSGGHFGVLGIDDMTGQTFGLADIGFLDALASVLGLSIEAARKTHSR
ncbi:GAF domain-containing protein [Roseomonas elaeocarpi]|uniref:GAF domain-containing protein n=1 Tax=Roseomonas elaeocarpi TaxID=907779 RepID=A0ABV6JLY3_9PROT